MVVTISNTFQLGYPTLCATLSDTATKLIYRGTRILDTSTKNAGQTSYEE